MPWLEPYEWTPPVGTNDGYYQGKPGLVWTSESTLALFWFHCDYPNSGIVTLYRQDFNVADGAIEPDGAPQAESVDINAAGLNVAAISIESMSQAVDGSIVLHCDYGTAS
jgi:hypothetical protein